MQKQEIGPVYETEYAPMDWYFRENGTNLHIDFYTVPKGRITHLHYHDAVELGLCLDGEGLFRIDGSEYPFGPGAMTVIYPNRLHRACSTGSRESRWFFLTIRDPQRTQPEQAAGERRSGFTSDSTVGILMRQILIECETFPPRYETCVLGLYHALMVYYERMTPPREYFGEDRDPSAMEKLEPLLHHIRTHYMDNLTARSMAEFLFVHESTLRYWFRRALAITPLQYLHQTRVNAACTMLQYSAAPITQIAEQVGYQSLSAFHRNFITICGCAPREFRRKKTVVSDPERQNSEEDRS